MRYVGLSTAVGSTYNVVTSASIRYYANDWTGRLFADFTSTAGAQRSYGTNGHGDITWLSDNVGAVTRTLRYDPDGNLIGSSGTSLPPFRFQGSWRDSAAELYWVVTRWYAPAQARFVSEDSLLGQPDNPDSRHLYAYAEGDCINQFDLNGRRSSRGEGKSFRCSEIESKLKEFIKLVVVKSVNLVRDRHVIPWNHIANIKFPFGTVQGHQDILRGYKSYLRTLLDAYRNDDCKRMMKLVFVAEVVSRLPAARPLFRRGPSPWEKTDSRPVPVILPLNITGSMRSLNMLVRERWGGGGFSFGGGPLSAGGGGGGKWLLK